MDTYPVFTPGRAVGQAVRWFARLLRDVARVLWFRLVFLACWLRGHEIYRPKLGGWWYWLTRRALCFTCPRKPTEIPAPAPVLHVTINQTVQGGDPDAVGVAVKRALEDALHLPPESRP